MALKTALSFVSERYKGGGDSRCSSHHIHFNSDKFFTAQAVISVIGWLVPVAAYSTANSYLGLAVVWNGMARSLVGDVLASALLQMSLPSMLPPTVLKF